MTTKYTLEVTYEGGEDLTSSEVPVGVKLICSRCRVKGRYVLIME